MKILAIDDIRDNLITLKAVIKEAFPEAAVYLAINGKDGIELALTVDPDVILLDIIMPEMDGFEVCRRLKQNQQTNHIPIVFLTALKTSPANRIKALEEGGDGFLSKPVNREELIAQVKAMSKIKAAAEQKKIEKEQLEKMVTKRTVELEKEIKLRINTEMQLRESEGKYRTLIDDVLDTSDVGVFILDAQFRVVWINEATENYFGIKRKDVIGKDKKKLVREHIKFQFEDPEKFDRKVLSAYENNTYIENFVCHMLPGKNREDRWLEHWSQPVRSGLYKGGRIEHYTDITRLKKAEDQLKESRDRYQIISELSSDYVFQNKVDEKGNNERVWVGGSFREITGYTLDEFNKIGGWRNILHPDDIARDDEAFDKIKRNQKSSLEVRIIHKSGRIVWVRSSGYPIWDYEKNRLSGIMGAVKDITEEKTHQLLQEILLGVTKTTLTEKNLSKLFAVVQHEMNKVMDASNFMVVEWDEAGQMFNTRFGKDEKDLIKKYPAEGTLSLKIIQQKKSLLLLKKDILKMIEKGEIIPKGAIPEMWMGVPLFNTDQLFGLMMIQHYRKPNQNSVNCFKIFETVAGEVSIFLSRLITEKENARLSRAVQQNPASIIITDPEGNMEFVNDALCEITAYSREELIGQNPRILKSGEQQESFYKEMWDTILRGETWRGKFHNKKKNGELYWANSVISPLFDEEGKIIQYVATEEDITEEKRNYLIQKVQFNIAHSMVTSPTLNDLFTRVKTELNKILYAKNFFIALFDTNTGNLTAQLGEDEKEFVTIIPSESLSGKVIKARKPLLFTRKEIKQLADKGEIILVGKRAEIWLGAPLVIKDNVLGVVVVQSYDNPRAYDEKDVEIMGIIANQISLYIEQKRTEEFNLKLSKATEQSPAAIVITNTKGTIEYVNPKFTENSGYTLAEAIGKNPRILKSGEHDKNFYKELWDTVLSGKEWEGELHNKKKNGDLFWENVRISPIFNETGEITHLLAIKEEITEKKKMLTELIAAKEKAQESDRLKTAFLQNMSHELRTPLNGILGFSQLLSADDMDIQSIKEYASYIEASGNRLMGLINNILDVSKIEAGVVEIQKKPFYLNSLINEVYQSFKIRLNKKGINLELKKGLPDERSVIVTDEARLNQIIMNLMDNAFKFTDSGKIRLAYEVTDKNELLFSVQDTGRGIAPEHQERIFERFYQVDISISRGFEGAGLGLPISKGLVESLGGKMWLQSAPVKGTTFYFTIPYLKKEIKNPTTTNKYLAQKISQKQQKTILIVEDDETSYYFLQVLLKKRNYEILYANCGETAVEICQSRADIDLVLMDIKMIGMNGLEATKKIKTLRPELPVIAQTAYAFSTDKEMILNAGCDDYITKPIHKQELFKKMDKLLKKKIG